MKKIIKTILIASFVPLSYFPAHYASTVEIEGMQAWGSAIAMVMFILGLCGTLVSIMED